MRYLIEHDFFVTAGGPLNVVSFWIILKLIYIMFYNDIMFYSLCSMEFKDVRFHHNKPFIIST
mgnify:CR=1 FL=1